MPEAQSLDPKTLSYCRGCANEEISIAEEAT